MARWLSRALVRLRGLVAKRRVRFTLKALRELESLGLGLDPEDAVDLLSRLTAKDCAGRRVSEVTGEWLFIFEPRVAGTLLYVKLLLRDDLLVVSFHEEEGDSHEGA